MGIIPSKNVNLANLNNILYSINRSVQYGECCEFLYYRLSISLYPLTSKSRPVVHLAVEWNTYQMHQETYDFDLQLLYCY